MKKSLFIGTLIVLILFTGCSKERKLDCIQEIKGMKYNYILDYNSDKLKSIKIRNEYSLSIFSDEEKEIINNKKFCSNTEQLIGIKLENCVQEDSSDVVVISGDYLEEEVSKNKMKYKEAKDYYEKSGFECK